MNRNIIEKLKTTHAAARPELHETLAAEVEKMMTERRLSADDAIEFVVNSYNWDEMNMILGDPIPASSIESDVVKIGAKAVAGNQVEVGVYFNAKKGEVWHSANVTVFVPSNDSLSELKDAGLKEARKFLQEVLSSNTN